MRLAIFVVKRPGTQLVDIALVVPQYSFHGLGITGAGGLDHRKGQKLNAFVVGFFHPRLTSLWHQRHQFCSQLFQRFCPVPLDGTSGHSHECADLAVCQFQNTVQNQNALRLLGQLGKCSGHKLVVDM